MPFLSEAQRRYMWANNYKLAKKWSDKYGQTPSQAALKRRLAKGKKRGNSANRKP